MYPYIRMWHQLWTFRKAPKLGLFDTHISRHRIWPVDLDPWRELNNGRTLTPVRSGADPAVGADGL